MAVPPASSAAPEPDLPANAVILFVASWCAPCIEELRDFDRLEKSAAPQRLRVASLDPARSRRMLVAGLPPAAVLAWPPRVAAERLAALPDGNNALPTSVMTDAAGHPCSVLRRAIRPEDLAAMRRQCRQGHGPGA